MDHDTAYLYCRIRICPTGPCPNDCSSGRERREFDEPVFEALVQSSDPYKIDSGPLLGATIYREPNRKNTEMEVVEIEVLDGKSEAEIEERFSFGDIIRDATLTQGTALFKKSSKISKQLRKPAKQFSSAPSDSRSSFF